MSICSPPTACRPEGLARIVYQWRLREIGGTQDAAMEATNLIAIAGGRIALYDELCSGIMPQA